MPDPSSPASATTVRDDGFDPVFYVRHYPDVAAAGLDPRAHYRDWGRAEGRLPRRLHAVDAEELLWLGAAAAGSAALDRLATAADPLERGWALWARLRWHLADGDGPGAARGAARALWSDRAARRAMRGAGVCWAAFEAFAASDAVNDRRRAAAVLRRAARSGTAGPDRALALLLCATAGEADAGVATALTALYAASGLAVPVPGPADPGTGQPRFDRLAAPHVPPGARWHLARARDRLRDRLAGAGAGEGRAAPLVSVVVPARDAAATLPTALAGLAAQSWRALEILVVDDRSTDATGAVARAWAARDRRIRVLAGPGQGAYAARNRGMAAARGAFLTVHDADDWSHPDKIAEQIRPLLAEPGLPATVSHWVRTDPTLRPLRWPWERGEGWVHRNVSSLMIRASVRDRLGYWDRVRAGADTEYIERLVAAYGAGAIRDVRPGLPLAFGRVTAGALTRAADTHIRSRVFGPRRDYQTAAQRWHARALAAAGLPLEPAAPGAGDAAARAAALHLPARPARRPFAIPPALGVGDPEAPLDAGDVIRRADLFDARWYLEQNPDVRADGIDPARHYLRSGAAQGRDPGPGFSTTGYRAAHDAGFANPLVHYETLGRAAGLSPCPALPGALAGRAGPRWLVFGHQAGARLFGAERSLLDMLDRFVAAGAVPVVVIPRAPAPAYLHALRARAGAVHIRPLPWWHVHRPPHPDTLAGLGRLIAETGAAAVHVNTCVLQAPRLAGRAAGVPVTVHLREMPAGDAAIRAAILGTPADTAPPPPETAGTIRAALLAEADRFVANSPAAAAWLDAPGRTQVVGNRVDPGLFDLPFAPAVPPRVALISSNIAKKGIADAVAVARALAARGVAARVRLIGPDTPDLAALGPLPANVEVPGYADGAREALSGADVVLCLSHFPESFGRTVLEALAAGRPVVAYDRGHPPVLIGRGAGAPGAVVPADDTEAAADAVAALITDPARLHTASGAARARARALLDGEMAVAG